MGHSLGTLEMAPTQITAALGLLKKTVPDYRVLEVGNADEDSPLKISIVQHANDRDPT
jgi:hypothetical protein